MRDSDTNPWTRWAEHVGPGEVKAIEEAVMAAEVFRPQLDRFAELCAAARYPVTICMSQDGRGGLSDAAVECIEGDSGYSDLRAMLLDMASVLVYAAGDENGDFAKPGWVDQYPTLVAMNNAYYETPEGLAELAAGRAENQRRLADIAERRAAKEEGDSTAA